MAVSLFDLAQFAAAQCETGWYLSLETSLMICDEVPLPRAVIDCLVGRESGKSVMTQEGSRMQSEGVSDMS